MENCQLLCNSAVKQHAASATRGRSLSPTKIRKPFVGTSSGLLGRSNARQIALRKQKSAALKKQQALRSPTMVVPTEDIQPKTADLVLNQKNLIQESSDESEYSSLEDDDDAEGNSFNIIIVLLLCL